MFRQLWIALVFAVAVIVAFAAGRNMGSGQGSSTPSFAAVPGQKGGQDIWGGYEPDADWPKEISDLPGHGAWTWGAGQSIFAESPTAASLPANGGTGSLAEEGISAWLERGLELGVDARWEHCILVFDREGNIIEAWTQWDSMLQRPHFVAISPYDPEKHVWVIDDHKHIVHKFTHDGSELVQSIGTYGEPGADETHFNRPTMMDWLPDGTFFVADGYNGTRVVKFDADGNYLMSWGEPGRAGGETRPGYWNNVHGIAVDPETRRVFVNDRSNNRVQVFDENGNYLDEWSFGPEPTDIHDFMITADGYLWAADRGTNKMLKYDLDGNFLYAWGTWGDFPGGMWGVHGISVDEEGNFYVAEVDNGGFQKFVPRDGANPDFLVGPPVRSAW
jgi:hypothetical protein